MIFKSPYADVTIPDVSLAGLVLERLPAYGDKPALIDGLTDRTITYRQLSAAIQRVAAGLSQRGLRQGDVFAIYSPNLPEYVVAFHAVLLAGGVLTTLNPLYTVDEVVVQLSDCKAKYLLTISKFLDNAKAAAARCGIQEIFTFDPVEGATPFAALMEGNAPVPDVQINPAEDIAVLLAGGVLTTLNPLYTVDEVVVQLSDCKAKYLLTISKFLDNAKAAAARCGSIQEIFTFDPVEGATPFAALMAGDAPVPGVDINPAEDIAVLPYSSGTTGVGKGVMLTHRNVVANVMQCDGVTGVDTVSEVDRIIGVLPFYHIYGMGVIVTLSLVRGATIVTVPRFDFEQFLALIQKHKITRLNVVPPMLVALAKHPLVDKYDLSSLVELSSGAAPLSAELAQAVMRRLGCSVIQGYGLTETSPITHVYDRNLAQTDNRGSVGPLLPNTEAMIVDTATGRPVGVDERGELWIRGPQVMKGYLNNPEATAATIDGDGWLHTGDIGYADEQSFFFIVDRLKELIKYKGYQVAPAELEALLLEHPAVADVAVISSPDEEAGEVPKAFVVRKAEVTPDELMAWVAERVPPQRKIRRLEFIDAIPKSAAGKVLRRVLVAQERERARAAAAASVE